ncbi:MAG: hypothetical protein EA402_00185 [Planctomycetota bacterium]|nr:MAG: hypothetical protein EA402_00185 [Planctomycetota bacterium]
MSIHEAVLLAAGRGLKPYPAWDTVEKMLHPVIDRDGVTRPILAIQCQDFFRAGIRRVIVVVAPGEEAAYRRQLGELIQFLRQGSSGAAPQPALADELEQMLHALHFVVQDEALGIGHAIACTREAVQGEAFLLSFSDHLLLGPPGGSMSAALLALHQRLGGAVSSVEDLPDYLLKRYGVVGAQPLAGADGCWRVQVIAEKPSPTQAELELESPGLRRGRYLCLTGIHCLPSCIFDCLAEQWQADGPERGGLVPALRRLAADERYFAAQIPGRHQDIGTRYGMLEAQLARALSGPDRSAILSRLAALLAREAAFAEGAP